MQFEPFESLVRQALPITEPFVLVGLTLKLLISPEDTSSAKDAGTQSRDES